MIFNLKTHNSLFFNYFIVNLVALFIDIFTFFSLDFLLQKRFITYGIDIIPFHRDPANFTDNMSKTFPPFVNCIINNNNKIISSRTESFGCHLTFMELYEKIFVFLWVWLIFLIIAVFLHLLFLLLMFIPTFRIYLLLHTKPIHANIKLKKSIYILSQNCKVGDIFLLYKIKKHMSHARFYDLLCNLSSFCTVLSHRNYLTKS